MKVLETLKKRFPFLESRWFSRFSWIAAIFSPVPLSTQLYKAITAVSVDGISIEAYSLLALFHLAMIGRGIKTMDTRVTVNFSLTTIIAAAIAITTIIRGGSLTFF